MANIVTRTFQSGFRMVMGEWLNTAFGQINDALSGATAVSGITSTGEVAAKSATAATAGGVAAIAIGSGGVVIAFGSGAPTLSAGKGSLYLRTDGSSTSTRAYINTDGSTTWTDVPTAA